MRQFSFSDRLLQGVDNALKTLLPPTPRITPRQTPGADLEDTLTAKEARLVEGLMRINHAGEVCAQALYQGQALTAKLPNIRAKMAEAAVEEEDHLAWCETRLNELNAKTSKLNPLWYTLSFTIGATAGLVGDKWSLGFVVETERQVTEHLSSHLAQIPASDKKTQAILETMREDEMTHATVALEAGGASLPPPVKILMTLVSKLMTKTAYYI